MPSGGMASQLVTGKGVPLSEEGLKSGQDEMALKRKNTKTHAEREFLKLPEANFIASITVRNGVNSLSA